MRSASLFTRPKAPAKKGKIIYREGVDVIICSAYVLHINSSEGETKMTIYKNINWTVRNYDCTNVVFQKVPDGNQPRRFNGEIAPEGEWEVAQNIPAEMTDIGGFSGYSFYGFL